MVIFIIIIPKEGHTEFMISDFKEVNKRLIKKPFPIPQISTVLQELDGFTFALTLDLNIWVTKPYGWIMMHPKSSSLFSLGVNILISGYQ